MTLSSDTTQANDRVTSPVSPSTAMMLEPYLFFEGACEEALNFYKSVFGGEITSLMRFGDLPAELQQAPGYADRIMHASFASGTLKFMASDGGPGASKGSGTRVSMSLATNDVAEAERVFDLLGAGGHISMPMQDMFWGARFGTLTDKFGIDWMVNAAKG